MMMAKRVLAGASAIKPLFTELPGRSVGPYLIEIMYARRMARCQPGLLEPGRA